MGSSVGKFVGAVFAPVTGGLSLALGAGYDQKAKANKAAKKAAEAQAAQAQSLINEQKNAETNAKEQATAARRAARADDTKTIYTTALGDVSEASAGARKKKTLLGS